MKQEKKKRCTAWLHAIGALLLWGVILLCIILTIPRVFGYQLYHVISGSMEPQIPIGSLILTKEIQPQELEPGDIITFYGGFNQASTIVHRVVANERAEKQLITKGDANEQEDIRPVKYSYVLGKMVTSVPRLGWLAAAIGTWIGKAVLMIIAVMGFCVKNIASYMELKHKE